MRWRSFAATASFVLLAAHVSLARPGGGGSYSGGGGSRGGGGSYSGGRSGSYGGGRSGAGSSMRGSSSDDHDSIHHTGNVTLSPGEGRATAGALGGVVAVILLTLLVGLVIGRRGSWTGGRDDDDDDDAPVLQSRGPTDPIAPLHPIVGLEALKARDPAITFASIEARIHRMSAILRDAWCAGDMRAARPFVSDGVYGRFQVQLALMRREGRRNVMKDAALLDAELEGVETAAPLDVVHVRIQARARDTEVACDASLAQIDEALGAAAIETYQEIWSLVRRQGATTARDASAVGLACASCGAAILDAQGGGPSTAGEMIKCRYCGALLCSGEHDWVLAEITQLEAWHPDWPDAVGLAAFRAADPELAREVLEDRGSYLFWKWIEAGRLSSLTPLRKGATEAFLASRAGLEGIATVRDVAVGGVDLVGMSKAVTHDARSIDVARVKIFWSAIFGDARGGDSWPMTSILRLVRTSGVRTRASMTALACARCGAGIGESDTPTCDHCGANVAAGDDAWVLDGFEDVGDSSS